MKSKLKRANKLDKRPFQSLVRRCMHSHPSSKRAPGVQPVDHWHDQFVAKRSLSLDLRSTAEQHPWCRGGTALASMEAPPPPHFAWSPSSASSSEEARRAAKELSVSFPPKFWKWSPVNSVGVWGLQVAQVYPVISQVLYVLIV